MWRTILAINWEQLGYRMEQNNLSLYHNQDFNNRSIKFREKKGGHKRILGPWSIF